MPDDVGCRRQRVCGDMTSRCPIRHEIKLRILTLNPVPDPLGREIGSRWSNKIGMVFSAANAVFNRMCVRLLLTHRVDYPVEQSRRLLNEYYDNIANDENAEQSARDFLLEQSVSSYRYEFSRQQGVEDPNLVHSHWYVRLREEAGSSRDTRQVATEEALNILRLNRERNEICVYFVPGTTSPASAGQSFFSELWSNITSQNEGIFISRNARYNTLAHEMGHLLMRIAHCSLVGPNGRDNDTAPP